MEPRLLDFEDIESDIPDVESQATDLPPDEDNLEQADTDSLWMYSPVVPGSPYSPASPNSPVAIPIRSQSPISITSSLGPEEPRGKEDEEDAELAEIGRQMMALIPDEEEEDDYARLVAHLEARREADMVACHANVWAQRPQEDWAIKFDYHPVEPLQPPRYNRRQRQVFHSRRQQYHPQPFYHVVTAENDRHYSRHITTIALSIHGGWRWYAGTRLIHRTEPHYGTSWTAPEEPHPLDSDYESEEDEENPLR